MSDTLTGGAVYGTVRYGQARYGRPLQLGNTPLPTFSVLPLVARATGYTSIQVSWSRPTQGASLRLVRNSYGFSANESDGLVVLQQATQNYPAYSDLTLSPDQQGQFLYYTIWNQDLAGTWWRAGDVQTILPKNWGYGDFLKGLTPSYLFDMDDALVTGRTPIF